jgi:micrococcal nuclease
LISSKAVKTLLAVLLLTFLFLTPCRASTDRQKAVVEKALSGDTLRLKSGKTLRYIGVECYPMQSKVLLIQEYGEKALLFNESLVGGKEISLEWDSKIRDERNNLLAYVFLEDGRFVNLELLKTGHAKTRIRAPNTRYAAELRQGESLAQRDRKGIWEKEPVDPFKNKSLIGEKNTKLYYRPDSPELSRIPEAQWVYFNSRVDAKAAGYRACPTCRESAALEPEA